MAGSRGRSKDLKSYWRWPCNISGVLPLSSLLLPIARMYMLTADLKASITTLAFKAVPTVSIHTGTLELSVGLAARRRYIQILAPTWSHSVAFRGARPDQTSSHFPLHCGLFLHGQREALSLMCTSAIMISQGTCSSPQNKYEAVLHQKQPDTTSQASQGRKGPNPAFLFCQILFFKSQSSSSLEWWDQLY